MGYVNVELDGRFSAIRSRETNLGNTFTFLLSCWSKIWKLTWHFWSLVIHRLSFCKHFTYQYTISITTLNWATWIASFQVCSKKVSSVHLSIPLFHSRIQFFFFSNVRVWNLDNKFLPGLKQKWHNGSPHWFCCYAIDSIYSIIEMTIKIFLYTHFAPK